MNSARRTQLMQAYRDGPSQLEAAWSRVPAEARQWRPAPTEWSAHEIVIHCADSETAAYTRIRILAAETSPTIVGYDQDAWATAFAYHNLPIEPAFAVIRAVRAMTALVMENFAEVHWAQEGIHTESGRYTAEMWLESYGDHLQQHVSQIESNIALWQQHGRSEPAEECTR